MEKALRFKIARNGIKGKAVLDGTRYEVTFSNGNRVSFKADVVKANLATGVWVRSK